MTSITRTLALSLGVTATAIFLVTLGIVIWFDLAREREQTYCQTATAILNHATVVDPGHGLIIRSTGLKYLRSHSPRLWYVVSYDNLMSEFGQDRRPALPSLPYAGPIGLSVLNTLDQKSSFCVAVVKRGYVQARCDDRRCASPIRPGRGIIRPPQSFFDYSVGRRICVDGSGRRIPVRALCDAEHRTRDKARARNRAEGTSGVDIA